MADGNGNGRPRIEKKGGYSGSRPVSSMPPPPNTPSGTAVRPAEPAKRPS